MSTTRHRRIAVSAMVWALAMPACSPDARTDAGSSATTSTPSTRETLQKPHPVPRFGPRQDVATVTPRPEGERTSVVALSVSELAAGDLTGDGVTDLVVTHLRWSSVETYPLTLLVGDGLGSLRDATAELFDGPVPRTQHPRQTILADFNGDRRLDIFVADTGVDVAPFPGYLSHLALSLSDGRFADATANVAQPPGYAHSAAAGDIDGDGDVDLFLGHFTPRVLVNDGTGRFADGGNRLPASISGQFTRAEFVDANSDGPVDLVLIGDGVASAVLINDGAGSFTELTGALPVRPFVDDAIGTAIEPFDLNGDTHTDLVLAWTKRTPFYKGRWIQALVNNGDGTFRDETHRRLPQQDNADQWVYDIVVGDLNADRSLDVGLDLGPTFADPAHSLTPVFFLNRGDGSFAAVPAGAFGDPPPFGQFRLIDLDRDGGTDVVSAWAAPSGVETFAVSTSRP